MVTKKSAAAGTPTAIQFSDHEIGRLHNEALAFIYARGFGDRAGPLTGVDITRALNFLRQFLRGKGLAQKTVQSEVKPIRHLLRDAGILRGNRVLVPGFGKDHVKVINSILALLVSRGTVSKGLAGSFSELFNWVIKARPNAVEVVSKIEEVFVHARRRGNDRRVARIFADVCSSSFHFWSPGSGGVEPAKMPEDSTWVIINDGVGGVLGLVFGGFGSVAVGTVLSAWTNENLAATAKG